MKVQALQLTGKIGDVVDKLKRMDERSFNYWKQSALSEAAALEAARNKIKGVR